MVRARRGSTQEEPSTPARGPGLWPRSLCRKQPGRPQGLRPRPMGREAEQTEAPPSPCAPSKRRSHLCAVYKVTTRTRQILLLVSHCRENVSASGYTSVTQRLCPGHRVGDSSPPALRWPLGLFWLRGSPGCSKPLGMDASSSVHSRK